MRSEKLQKRAARVGFEWHDLKGPKEKLEEELEELDAATDEERLMEAGDVLFVAVNIVRPSSHVALVEFDHGVQTFPGSSPTGRTKHLERPPD